MLASVPGTILAATTGSPIPPSTQSKTKDLKTPRRKRIFHLSMTKTSVLSRVSSSSSLRASSRQRGRNLSSVAVFAEKRAQMVEQMARSMINNRPETSTVADDGISKDDKARKRPLTQSLSSQKLKDLSASASVISAKEEDTEASLALATELQQFTLDTTESTTVTDIAQPEEKVPQIFRKRPMKYQPRPPPPRNIQDAVTSQEKATPGFQNTPKDIIMGDNNQEEWVYDIYVRDVVPAVNQESSKLNNGGLGKANLGATENVGYLVIRSEDEAAWEEFMSDDEDSEGDWGGEDEDSNGKLLIQSFLLRNQTNV